MAQNTMIGGTSYGLSKGAPLINGTGYAVSKGRTLVSGTGYDISMSKGTPVSALAVGDSVYMNVDGVRTEFIVVHQGNPDTSIYDSSCDGTWVLMKDIYDNRKWHSSADNLYANSDVHSYLNSTFLFLLESGVRDAIKEVKIPYAAGYYRTSATKGSDGLSVRLFLLSLPECGFRESDNGRWPVDEGAKLDYFGLWNQGYDYDGLRYRLRAMYNGSYSAWWTRSQYNGSTDSAYSFYDSAYSTPSPSPTGVYSYSYGVRPAMILSQAACVDEESNIVA